MTPAAEIPSSLAVRAACLGAAAVITFGLFDVGAQPQAAGLLQAPWDKIAHFLVYAALTALLWKAAAGRMPVAVIAAVILIGGLDELHQAGLPGRVASMGDFVVDVGAALCVGAMLLLRDARGASGLTPPPRPAGR